MTIAEMTTVPLPTSSHAYSATQSAMINSSPVLSGIGAMTIGRRWNTPAAIVLRIQVPSMPADVRRLMKFSTVKAKISEVQFAPRR